MLTHPDLYKNADVLTICYLLEEKSSSFPFLCGVREEEKEKKVVGPWE